VDDSLANQLTLCGWSTANWNCSERARNSSHWITLSRRLQYVVPMSNGGLLECRILQTAIWQTLHVPTTVKYIHTINLLKNVRILCGSCLTQTMQSAPSVFSHWCHYYKYTVRIPVIISVQSNLAKGHISNHCRTYTHIYNIVHIQQRISLPTADKCKVFSKY